MADGFPTEQSVELRSDAHHEAQRYLARLSEHFGKPFESFKDPQERVDLFRSLTPDQFLELMTITNDKLRGKPSQWHWKEYQNANVRGKIMAVVAGTVMESPDMDSPEHPQVNFRSLYEQLRKEVAVDNLEDWATRMYVAINDLHIFTDGNGRLSRTIFTFINTGEFISEEKIIERPYLLQELIQQLDTLSIEKMLEKNRLTRFDWRKVGGLSIAMYYQVEENPDAGWQSESGLSARLKYIAAKRAGILKTRAEVLGINEEDISQCYASGELVAIPEGEEAIIKGEEDTDWKEKWKWTDEELRSFELEYAGVRDEWFNELLTIVGENNSYLNYRLRLAFSMPNPFHLRYRDIYPIVSKVANGATDDQLMEAINACRYISFRDLGEKQNFIQLARTALMNDLGLLNN